MGIDKKEQDYGKVMVLFFAVLNAVLSPFLAIVIMIPFGLYWMLVGLSLAGSGGTADAPTGPFFSQYLAGFVIIIYFILTVIWLITAYIKAFKSLKSNKTKIIIIIISVAVSILAIILVPMYKTVLIQLFGQIKLN